MSVWEPPKNDQIIRRSYWNERKRAAQLASVRNRQALESGGPVRLDVADLRRRLAERKAADDTNND